MHLSFSLYAVRPKIYLASSFHNPNTLLILKSPYRSHSASLCTIHQPRITALLVFSSPTSALLSMWRTKYKIRGKNHIFSPYVSGIKRKLKGSKLADSEFYLFSVCLDWILIILLSLLKIWIFLVFKVLQQHLHHEFMWNMVIWHERILIFTFLFLSQLP